MVIAGDEDLVDLAGMPEGERAANPVGQHRAHLPIGSHRRPGDDRDLGMRDLPDIVGRLALVAEQDVGVRSADGDDAGRPAGKGSPGQARPAPGRVRESPPESAHRRPSYRRSTLLAVDDPDLGLNTEETEYRDEVARRRRLSAAFLLFLFAVVPAIAFVVERAVF